MAAAILGEAGSGRAAESFEHWLATRLNERLPAVERRLAEVTGELKKLPTLPDMDALGSHGFHSNFTGDSESNWFSVSWPAARKVDGIALIPTRLSTQSGEMSNYGFPKRLRVEAILPGREERVVIAELEDSHLDFRRGDPVFFDLPPTELRALFFVPVDLPTFPGKSVRFFSVSELMVFEGERNIALEGELGAGFSIDAEVGWNIRYLVDGQSPLGPPEVARPGRSLGWHADIAESGTTTTWAEVDLGSVQRIDGVRIIAARGDSPVKGPGFGFPESFKIEVSNRPDDPARESVWDTGEYDFPNPGYNPVPISFAPVMGRFVRLSVTGQHQPDRLTAPRVLLSEFEVLDGTRNLALGKGVKTPDLTKSRPHDAKRVWSVSGLTDGKSSTGTLIPVRRWVSELSRRFDLALERRALLLEREAILKRTHLWALATVFTVLSAVIVGLVIWLLRIRHASRRHMRELRRRISSDLHDEVGSNIATISLLADLSPGAGDPERLGDISRLARESALSLREIIDLTIAPARARKPLAERLREIANLMLKDHLWEFQGDSSPDLDPEQRRNLIFFFKEALHNISRHAAADRVEIHFNQVGANLVLKVADNGRGLPPAASAGAPRLRTLEQRAESLHGSLDIDSSQGLGTTLTLRFPLQSGIKAKG